MSSYEAIILEAQEKAADAIRRGKAAEAKGWIEVAQSAEAASITGSALAAQLAKLLGGES